MILLAGLAASIWFLASTAATGLVPDAWFVALALAGGSALVLPAVGLPTRKVLTRLGREGIVLAAAAGALVFAVAPIVTLMCRRTDAPSGSESLFFTTAAWGVLVVLVAIFTRPRAAYVQLAGASLALLGAAAVVANWERPSSFSPFIKFPVAEVMILVAGLAFAIGSLMLARSVLRYGFRPALSVGWVTALVAAAAYALLSAAMSGSLASATSMVSQELPSILGASLAIGVLGLAWTSLVSRAGLARAATALFLPPLALTVIAAATHAQRALGPDPVQWAGVLGGALLIGSGSAVLYALEPAPGAGPLASKFDRGAASLAALGVLVGAWVLAAPAFQATVQGTVADTSYTASWVLIGLQSAAGWLPIAVALLILAATRDAVQLAWGVRRRTFVGACALIAAATLPLLTQTPLITWNTWLPAEVLQDLGTEYARMDLTPVVQPLGWVALACALGSAGLLVAGSVAWRLVVARRLEDRA